MRFLSVFLALPLTAATLQTTKPEDVGLSTDRLQRIHQTIQRHMDEHQISGAVTLVARKGRVAHLEAHGLMDVDSKKPMAKDSIFRVWSMSKPVVGVSILMLMEEGKIRLNDPVSKFIPEFKGMKVAVIQPVIGLKALRESVGEDQSKSAHRARAREALLQTELQRIVAIVGPRIGALGYAVEFRIGAKQLLRGDIRTAAEIRRVRQDAVEGVRHLSVQQRWRGVALHEQVIG